MSSPQPVRSPKKGPGSVPAPDYVDGSYFKLEHHLLDAISWIANGQCEHHLLLKLLSLTNQRAALLRKTNRPETGCTGILTAEMLAGEDPRRWDARSFQVALKRLSDLKAINLIQRAEAVKAEIVTGKEAAKAGAGKACVVRVNRENFSDLAEAEKKRQQPKLDFGAPPEDDDPDEGEGEGEPEVEQPKRAARARTIHITPKGGLAVLAGGKAPKLKLENDVRIRMALVKVIEGENATDFPVALSFALRENELRYRIAAAPAEAQSEYKAKPKRSKTSDLQSPQVIPLVNGTNGHRGNGHNGHSSDGFESCYPAFHKEVLSRFPPTPAALFQEIVTACIQAAQAEGLSGNWVTDEMLVAAVGSRGVTKPGQHSAGGWLRAKGAPGPLVICIQNWARSWVKTREIPYVDPSLSERDRRVLRNLENDRGTW